MSSELDAASAAAPLPAAPTARQLWQFRLSVVLLIGWIGFLTVTVWRTANPVLISRPQILSASLIVEGNFKADPVRLDVSKVWRGDGALAGNSIEIIGFTLPARFRMDVPYIVALEPIGHRKARIAETPSEPGIGTVIDDRVYPLTEASRRQLKDLLESRERLEKKAGQP